MFYGSGVVSPSFPSCAVLAPVLCVVGPSGPPNPTAAPAARQRSPTGVVVRRLRSSIAEATTSSAPTTIATQAASQPGDGPAAPAASSSPPSLYPDPIPGIIPFGTITLFAGAPGVGKTAMIADWIVRMRDGRTIWDHPTNHSVAYCYLAADRQWKSHQQWFDAVGYSDIPRYSVADDSTFDLKQLMAGFNAPDLFKKALDRGYNGQPVPEGAFVITDPVSPLFIAGNPNDARHVARSLLSMSRECQERRITLLLTAHFGKQRADKTTRYQRPQDRIAGSTAFSGFSDTQIYLVDPEPPDYPYHVLGWNPRHQRPEEFPCQRTDTGLFEPYDVLKEDGQAAQILDCLSEAGPSPVSVIADRAFDLHGWSRATVKRALERLVTQGRVARIGHGRATKYQRVKLH